MHVFSSVCLFVLGVAYITRRLVHGRGNFEGVRSAVIEQSTAGTGPRTGYEEIPPCRSDPGVVLADAPRLHVLRSADGGARNNVNLLTHPHGTVASWERGVHMDLKLGVGGDRYSRGLILPLLTHNRQCNRFTNRAFRLVVT